MNKPLLSVACLAFNHEKYIRKALDGFLMQKTNFPIEIIVHDDASTDNTANIIREYEKKHPGVIKPIYQKENQYSKGIKPSQTFVWPNCSGKYIALCEGDDYWTDPDKLQKQVDFLEKHQEYIMSFHKVKVSRENAIFDDYLTVRGLPKSRDTFDTYDLSKANFVPTCSVVFRNVMGEYADNKVLKESKIGDYVLYLYLSLRGKIRLHNDCMGVYRVHKGGIWSMQNKQYLRKQYLELLIDNFSHESKKTFINRYVRVLLICMVTDLARGKVSHAVQNYRDGLKRVEHFSVKLFYAFFEIIKNMFASLFYRTNLNRNY